MNINNIITDKILMIGLVISAVLAFGGIAIGTTIHSLAPIAFHMMVSGVILAIAINLIYLYKDIKKTIAQHRR